ncbi:MAG TPA: hypothetical protein VFI38_09980 [Candidatus Acidoferrum sp.]|nr:hypothetical protein [Candidatus Acidoferrum sp.]
MRTTKSKTIRKQPAVPRPKLVPVSEETRRWSALLESELLSWPGVIAKRMFGFRTLYRGKRIFAALPNTRGFGADASLLIKFHPMPPALLKRAQTDSRVRGNTPGSGWLSFTLSSDTDLHDALEWLNSSYEAAAKRVRR